MCTNNDSSEQRFVVVIIRNSISYLHVAMKYPEDPIVVNVGEVS